MVHLRQLTPSQIMPQPGGMMMCMKCGRDDWPIHTQY